MSRYAVTRSARREQGGLQLLLKLAFPRVRECPFDLEWGRTSKAGVLSSQRLFWCKDFEEGALVGSNEGLAFWLLVR